MAKRCGKLGFTNFQEGISVAFLAAVFGLFLYAFYFFFSSGLFLQPKGIVYEKENGVWYATLKRTVPYGDVWAAYHQEMYSYNLKQECHDPVSNTFNPESGENWTSFTLRYEDTVVNPDGTESVKKLNRYEVPPSLVPCLEAGGKIDDVIRWKVQFLGIFHLRPVVFETDEPVSVTPEG